MAHLSDAEKWKGVVACSAGESAGSRTIAVVAVVRR